MIHRASAVSTLWAEQLGLRRGYLVDVVTAVLLGALTIVGGRARTAGPAFAVLNASGGPLLWGAVLVAAGLALVAASFHTARTIVVVLIVTAGLYALFGLWFLRAAAHPPTSWWGPVLCARATAMHLSRAWAYYDDAAPEDPHAPTGG